MKLFVFGNTQSNEVELIVREEGYNQEITIFKLNNLGVVYKYKSQWSEIDRRKDNNELEFLDIINTFHEPWAELFQILK